MYSTNKKFCIYAIRCVVNGKLYIGRTLRLEERIKIHFAELKSGRHSNNQMLDDYKKYGKDNFEVYVIEENVPYEERKKEYEYMRKYNSFDEKYGYNRGDRKKKESKEFECIHGLPPNNFESDNLSKEKE